MSGNSQLKGSTTAITTLVPATTPIEFSWAASAKVCLKSKVMLELLHHFKKKDL